MMSQHLSSSFLFCFYAPKEDDEEPTLIIVFFCFASMHLTKMTKN
jgi:hypothetical protein